MKIDLSGVQAPTYNPIPAGDYVVDIVHAEVRDTQNGAGKYVNVEMQVQMPDGNTRTLYDVIVFEHNTSAIAQEIGSRRLRSLSDSVGQDAADFDPLELAGNRVQAKIGIQKKDADRNEVKVYKPLSDDAPAPAPVRADAPAPTNSAEPQLSNRPW